MSEPTIGMPLPLEKTGDPRLKIPAAKLRFLRAAVDRLRAEVPAYVALASVGVALQTGANIQKIYTAGEDAIAHGTERHAVLASEVATTDGVWKELQTLRLGAAEMLSQQRLELQQKELAQERRAALRDRVLGSAGEPSLEDAELTTETSRERTRRGL